MQLDYLKQPFICFYIFKRRISVKSFFNGKPSAFIIAITLGVSAAVITLSVVAAMISAKAGARERNHGGEAAVTSDGQAFSIEQDSALSVEPGSTCAVTTELWKKPEYENTPIKGNSFSSLGIKGADFRRLKYLTDGIHSMYSRDLRDNSLASVNLKDYIVSFADYYGLKNNPCWYAAQSAYNSSLRSSNQKCLGALSINDFNKILYDLYGAKAPALAYSDFPELSRRDASWCILHAPGSTSGSVSCDECLVLVEYANSSSPEKDIHIGFKLEGGKIKAVSVELMEFNGEKLFLLRGEVSFVKNGGRYCLDSVNDNCHEGGESSAYPIDWYKGYTFYSYSDESPVVVDMYKKYKIDRPGEATTIQKPQGPSSAREAYEEYVNGKTHDSENTRYGFIDIDKDGVEELFVTGQESEGSRFYLTDIYSCVGDDYSIVVVDNIYSFHEPMYYAPESLIFYMPEGPTGGERYIKFYRKQGNSLVEVFEIYCVDDGNGNTDYYRIVYASDGSEVSREHLGQQCVYFENNKNVETKELN